MSNRTDPPTQEDLTTTRETTTDEQSSLTPPARPALVGSGMFLPALIVLAIAVVVIVYLAMR